jgi:hypothetical protein
MRVVISHESFEVFGGTETYMFTVAQHLDWLGHETLIYAQRIGPIAEFARNHGVRATASAVELPPSCDAVLAQDAGSALELAGRYPSAVSVFVAHSRGYAAQIPPQLEGVCQAIVVLNDRVRRFIEQLPFHPQIVRLRQPIDLQRFGSFGLYPPQPRRALFIGNYMHGAQAQLLEEACRAAGMDVSFLGAHARVSATPEHAIADADVVIGLGRCILEAMASRRAAYVYGVGGADGWVTPARYAALEADGFSGQVGGTPLDRDALASDLHDWDVGMGHSNRALAAAHHGATKHAMALVELMRDHGAPDRKPLSHAQELARLVRLEWRVRARFAGAVEENTALRERAEKAELEAAQARASAEAHLRELSLANQRLQDLRATRRYRFACRLAAPLDALRSRFGAGRDQS